MADFRHTAFLCATWYRYRSRETWAVSSKCVLFGSCHQHHVRSHRYKPDWHSISSQRYLYLPPACILKLCILVFPRFSGQIAITCLYDTKLFYLVVGNTLCFLWGRKLAVIYHISLIIRRIFFPTEFLKIVFHLNTRRNCYLSPGRLLSTLQIMERVVSLVAPYVAGSAVLL
jgi:hypothetical protein